MPWFRVDDKFHSHKKAARAGTEPLGLWLLCGSWASDQLTDGFVPDYVARRFDPNADDLADRLVAAGLWTVAEHDGDGGWRFHDWGGMNPTRDQVESKREYERDKKRAQRGAGHANTSRGDNGQFRSVSPGDNHGDTGRDSPGEFVGESPATRPVPTQPTTNTSSAAADGAFDEFWKLYPRKVDKGHARKAHAAALKRANRDEILAGLATYAESVRSSDPKFIAHAQTWLNGDRWADEAPREPEEVWDRGEWA